MIKYVSQEECFLLKCIKYYNIMVSFVVFLFRVFVIILINPGYNYSVFFVSLLVVTPFDCLVLSVNFVLDGFLE